MPAKSAWLPRIGSILAELHVLKSDYLDRQAVERIFGVRQRRARQLMGGLRRRPKRKEVPVQLWLRDGQA
jgi:hypothetical protein